MLQADSIRGIIEECGVSIAWEYPMLEEPDVDTE